MTFEHIRYDSAVMDEVYKSDNAALFFQYDQRFWDRLSVSAGVRAEYYRVKTTAAKQKQRYSEQKFRSAPFSVPD